MAVALGSKSAHSTLPGMKHAVIARPPVYGGRLVSVDSSEALKVPGVERVVTLEGTPPPSAFKPLGGVAVIARNTWAAMQGREKLKLTWDDGPHASYDSTAYARALGEAVNKPGKISRILVDTKPEADLDAFEAGEDGFGFVDAAFLASRQIDLGAVARDDGL